MKWITGMVTMLLLAGCTLTREVPPVQRYHLYTSAVPTAPSAIGCKKRVIRIALIQAPQWLQGTTIQYAGDDQKFYNYTRARWATPPVEQLQQIVEKRVTDSGLFAGVLPYKSLGKNDWLLEIRMETMLQSIEAGKSHTELMLYGVLIDQYSRHVLSQKTFRYRHADVTPNSEGAVDVWSEDIGTFTAELNAWLEAECRTQPKVDRSDVDL